MASYATFVDVERFFEGFATSYYGHTDNNAGTLQIMTGSLADDLAASYNRINVELSSIARIPVVPIGTSIRTGGFHPHLIEWNAVDTIFNKMKSRHAAEFRDKLPEWMYSFATRAQQIVDDIVTGRVVVDTDTITKGIGYPVSITKVGVATMHTNWDTGFYWKMDYPKTFRFKITATTAGNEIGQAYFQVSEDNGYSYLSDSLQTGTGWISIQGGLKIRWEPAATLYAGTEVQLNLNDTFQVKCVPTNAKSTGRDSTFRRWGRG